MNNYQDDPTHPHNALAKTWEPGQQWQIQHAPDGPWYDLPATRSYRPGFFLDKQYRRKPEPAPSTGFPRG